jgi:hypothetical protein
MKFFDKSRFRYEVGIEISTIEEIRKWDYGILLLPKLKSRGIDTRFLKDALVLIICNVENYH